MFVYLLYFRWGESYEGIEGIPASHQVQALATPDGRSTTVTGDASADEQASDSFVSAGRNPAWVSEWFVTILATQPRARPLGPTMATMDLNPGRKAVASARSRRGRPKP